MGPCLLAVVTAGMAVGADPLRDDLDLYTATCFDRRLASVCSEYGLHAGYAGQLAAIDWPPGVRVGGPGGLEEVADISCFKWQVTSKHPERAPDPVEELCVLFEVEISTQRHRRTIASCAVNGQQLHLRVTHVHRKRSVDDPIPPWALSDKAKASGVSVRKLMKRLQEAAPVPGETLPRKEEAAGVGLHALNYFHLRLDAAPNGPKRWPPWGSLAMYYRGPLGRHEAEGRDGFPLPKVANPLLTWDVVGVEGERPGDQRLVCEVTVSLRKGLDTLLTYDAGGKPWYVSVSRIVGGHGVDDKLPELSFERKAEHSIRELLAPLGRKPEKRGK
jgi:hypothetical protein